MPLAQVKTCCRRIVTLQSTHKTSQAIFLLRVQSTLSDIVNMALTVPCVSGISGGASSAVAAFIGGLVKSVSLPSGWPSSAGCCINMEDHMHSLRSTASCPDGSLCRTSSQIAL